MANRHIVDRKLPERANLMFYFPVPTQGGDYYVIEVPFFENVSIKESKKAKYQKYSMISRSSNLYSYQGADSRSLSLTFNMTLPHILDDHPGVTLDQFIKYAGSSENVAGERERFLKPHKNNTAPIGMAFELGTKYTKDLANDTAREVLRNSKLSNSLTETEQQFMRGRYGIAADADIINEFGPNAQSDQYSLPIEQHPEYYQNNLLKYRIIDLIIYWTNIIRSSVVNNAKNPIYGPPIIRLRHGILYQDIPCICTNYSIDYNEAAGYDIDTLLPRQIKITMKLEEIRTGDFGEFDAGDFIKRDNLAGWEAVVENEHHSMDPGYRS